MPHEVLPEFDPSIPISAAEVEVIQFLETVHEDPKREELRLAMREIADEDGGSLRELAHNMLGEMAEGMAENLVDEGISLLKQVSDHGIIALEPVVDVLRRAVAALETPDDDTRAPYPSNDEASA